MTARVFDFDRALVRLPARSVVDALRVGVRPPRYGRVLAEHRAYVAALEAAGVAVDTLPALEEHPDSVFVEDAAFVLGQAAILLRPGAVSRFAEPVALAPALNRHFAHIDAVDRGFVDGGDILVLPDAILVGLSERTDATGARRFCGLVGELGRSARIVEPPPGLLHLKTGCALVDERTLLALPELAPLFPGYEVLPTPDGEAAAANLLRVNGRILMAAGYPKTAAILAGRGVDLVALEAAEIALIDAGLSCMSLRWLSVSGSSGPA
ncbi:MAG TPA: dimethylarginine dimethylaminohydrolase [Allosphingosinicella sp.]|nr:dimethylarginine dimethylaminohydrolase [Allosphingosinicella sp.]